MKSSIYSWILALGCIVLLVAIIPFSSGYIQTFIFNTLMFLIFAASWNIFSGYSGYVSLGHVTFFGVGAYVAAFLITKAGLAPPISIIIGGLAASALAASIGGVVLRLRGAYFSIATFGLNEVFKTIAVNMQKAEGTLGIVVPPIPSRALSCYIALIIALITVLTTFFMERSRIGYALISIRADEKVAEGLGINTFKYKLIAYAIGSFFPGLLGGLFAWHAAYIDPHSVFTPFYSFYSMIFSIFGGVGTVLGPVIGTTILSIFQELLWARLSYLYLLIYGAAVAVIILYMPKGLLGAVKYVSSTLLSKKVR
jgi:branched-chain amino acid transport system permease protein